MKSILIFGAGAIGSVFGGFLSRHNKVSLLGRSWHLNIIKKKGLIVTGIWGRHLFKNFELYTEVKEIAKDKIFDLVLLTVKADDTDTAAKQLRNIVKEKTVVISLQNGLGNIEILNNYLPSHTLLAGRVIFGAELSPGMVKVTVSAAPVVIGEVSCKKITKRLKEIVHLFNTAGIETKAVNNVESYLWHKAIYNSALNALATLLEVNYGKLLEFQETRMLMRKIVEECYQIKDAMGVELKAKTAQGYINSLFKKLIPKTAQHHPSMLQAIRRGAKTEIDFLNGYFTRKGEELNIVTSINYVLTELIKAKFKLGGKQWKN